MKKQPSPPQQPRQRPQTWSGRSHLKALVIALVAWIGLFLIVLLEHGRSWAKLLPLLFVVIVIYGAFVTWTLIRETSKNRNSNNQRYR